MNVNMLTKTLFGTAALGLTALVLTASPLFAQRPSNSPAPLTLEQMQQEHQEMKQQHQEMMQQHQEMMQKHQEMKERCKSMMNHGEGGTNHQSGTPGAGHQQHQTNHQNPTPAQPASSPAKS